MSWKNPYGIDIAIDTEYTHGISGMVSLAPATPRDEYFGPPGGGAEHVIDAPADALYLLRKIDSYLERNGYGAISEVHVAGLPEAEMELFVDALKGHLPMGARVETGATAEEMAR